MGMKVKETMHPIQSSPAPWLMGVGLLEGIGLLYAAYRMGQQRHARTQRELLTAGQWILNRAGEVAVGVTSKPEDPTDS